MITLARFVGFYVCEERERMGWLERESKREGEHITKQHPSKNPKRRKKGERKPRSRLFRQNKNKNPPVRTSSSPLSLLLFPLSPSLRQSRPPGPSDPIPSPTPIPDPPQFLRASSSLLPARGICSFFPQESHLGRRLGRGLAKVWGRVAGPWACCCQLGCSCAGYSGS